MLFALIIEIVYKVFGQSFDLLIYSKGYKVLEPIIWCFQPFVTLK